VIFNQLVLKADYLLDLYAGDVWEKIVPMTIYWITGNDKIDRTSEEMARAFSTDFILTIPVDGAPVPPIMKSLDRGIPAMVAEAGNAGLVEESAIDFHFTGVLNVLKQFRMIEGSLERVISAPRIFGKVHTIKATVGGFYICKTSIKSKTKPVNLAA
jgi:predicted deacylase